MAENSTWRLLQPQVVEVSRRGDGLNIRVSALHRQTPLGLPPAGFFIVLISNRECPRTAPMAGYWPVLTVQSRRGPARRNPDRVLSEGRAAMTNHSEILRRWQLLSPYLNQRQQTLWAAAEAEVIGRRGCLLLASVTGITRQTILKRKCQFELTGMAQGFESVGQREPGRPALLLLVNRSPIVRDFQDWRDQFLTSDPSMAGPSRTQFCPSNFCNCICSIG